MGINADLLVRMQTDYNIRLFLYSEIHVVFYVYLSLFGILGGNQDNTVGTAGTVDGCRGCILEHVDAFDIVGWDVINA